MAVRQDASTGEIIDDGRVQSKDGKPTMHVRVYSPFTVYFDQSAYSVSAENATGPFDILPHHHNFISLLQQGEISIGTETGPTKIKIGGGLMHVCADTVTVFLDV